MASSSQARPRNTSVSMTLWAPRPAPVRYGPLPARDLPARPGRGQARGMGRVLVGRDAECAALSRALAAAQGRGAPVVLVSGEAGAGKTTLVEHVLPCTGMPALSGRAAEWAGAA